MVFKLTFYQGFLCNPVLLLRSVLPSTACSATQSLPLLPSVSDWLAGLLRAKSGYNPDYKRSIGVMTTLDGAVAVGVSVGVFVGVGVGYFLGVEVVGATVGSATGGLVDSNTEGLLSRSSKRRGAFGNFHSILMVASPLFTSSTWILSLPLTVPSLIPAFQL